MTKLRSDRLPVALTFRQWQFIALLVFATMPILFVFGVALPGIQESTVERAREQLETIAELRTAEIDRQLEQSQLAANLLSVVLAQNLSNADQPAERMPVNEGSLLQSSTAIFPNFLAVSLVDPETSKIIYSTDPGLLNHMRSQEVDAINAGTNNFISPVSYSVDREMPLQTIAVPISTETNPIPDLIIVIDFDVNNLQEVFRNPIEPGESGRSYIVDSNGFYVATSKPGAPDPIRAIASSEGVDYVLAKKSGSDSYHSDAGELVLGVYRWLPDVQLGLLVELDRSEILGDYRHIQRLLLALELILVLLAFAAARSIGDGLMRPLTSITAAARALQAGDLNRRVQQPATYDELALLASAFNDMAASIQVNQQNLEQLIHQRTQRLEAANKQLHDEIEIRKKNETTIQISRDILSHALIAANAGVWERNIKTDELIWSDENYQLLGLTREEVVKPTYKRWLDSIHPDDRLEVDKAMQTAVVERKDMNLEFRVVWRDGTVRWMYGGVRVVFEDNDHPVRIYGLQIDITERKIAEEALIKTNRAYRTISASSHVLIHATGEKELLDEICKIVVTAGYLLAWVGLPLYDENHTVMPVAQAGYEDGYIETLQLTWADSERGRGPTGTAIRTGEPFICRNILKDPRFKPWRDNAIQRGYSSSIAVPMITEGHVIGVLNIYASEPNAFDEQEVNLLLVLANDLAYGISSLRGRAAQREAEAALLHTHYLLEQAQRIAHIGSWEWDILTERLQWSDEMYRIFFAEPEKIGSDITIEDYLEMIHPEDRDRVSNNMAQRARDGLSADIECRIIRSDGEIRHIHIQGHALLDEKNRQIRRIGVVHDITDRQHAAQELRKLSSAVEQSANSVIITNTKAVIEYVNPKFEEITGYTQSEVIGKTPSILKSGQTSEETYSELWETITRGDSWSGELLNKRKDGDLYWIHSSISIIRDVRGLITHYLAIQEDVTERKAAEEALRDYSSRLQALTQQLLQVQEQERQRISRELHDEIGQALTALKISLEITMHTIPDSLSDTKLRVRDLVGLADVTLEQVRVIAQDLRPAALDTLGLVATLEGYCNEFSQRTGIAIQFEARNKLPDDLSGALRIAFYRILQESLTNMVKHSQARKGEVIIDYVADRVELSINDNGRGITQLRTQQQGIGLAGISERVELLGGTFAIQSAAGEGTRIIVSIPAVSDL